MVSFDLMKYWDGRPVWFACCERDKKTGKGPGEMIWCVGFEIIEDDAEGEEDDDEEEEGEKKPQSKVKQSEEPKPSAGNDISEDVD